MSKKRASIFTESDADDVLDVGGFAPKTAVDVKAPPAEQVRAVAEAAQFRSREGATPKVDAQFKRTLRRYTTGRNVQFNAKVSQATADAIYAVTNANVGWVLGYTLERAMAALHRELEVPK